MMQSFCLYHYTMGAELKSVVLVVQYWEEDDTKCAIYFKMRGFSLVIQLVGCFFPLWKKPGLLVVYLFQQAWRTRDVCASLQYHSFFRTSGLVLSFSQTTLHKLQTRKKNFKKIDESILLCQVGLEKGRFPTLEDISDLRRDENTIWHHRPMHPQRYLFCPCS